MNIGIGAHIGDALWLCIMLSKLPGQHTLYVNNEYVDSIRDLMEGTLVTVEPITQKPPGTQDGWIANGRFPQYPYTPQVVGTDILGYVRHYLNLVAAAGRDLIPDAESMLMDLPSLEQTVPVLPFDILAVNCNPLSGQVPGYSGSEFDGLLLKLVGKGHRVLATNPTTACPWGNFTLSQIGALSTKASVILGVSSGPLAPTFNVWNKGVPRYVFLSPFILNYGPNVKITHAANAAEMTDQLAGDGIL
jgi:hypothetical protein